MLTVTEAATAKGVHPHSVRQAIKERRLPAEKKGNMYLIARRDLDAWVVVRRQQKRSETASAPD